MRSGDDTIYALIERGGEPGSGEWTSAHNTWREGEPLPPLDPLPGLYPRSAFYQTFPD